ncbi:MAG TPA: DinB family protein [Gemmatimonadaceae bacterium]|nr:DinB family protein [Gemmatimonadaceae bacterium]
MRTVRFMVVAAALAAVAPAATAQGMGAAAAEPTTGYRAEFLKEIKYFEGRFTQLAEAIPPAKYTWRPAEGVRSVSEVLLHIAGANQGLPNFAGIKPPAGFSGGPAYEKSTTDKAKVIAEVKKSFEHIRAAAAQMSDADAEKAMKVFGMDMTGRSFAFFMARHLGEHLGQLIAYARVNGVVPPWSD